MSKPDGAGALTWHRCFRPVRPMPNGPPDLRHPSRPYVVRLPVLCYHTTMLHRFRILVWFSFADNSTAAECEADLYFLRS